jgi:hypothetical protein
MDVETFDLDVVYQTARKLSRDYGINYDPGNRPSPTSSLGDCCSTATTSPSRSMSLSTER